MGIYTVQELRNKFAFRLGTQDRFYLSEEGKPIIYPIRILMSILKPSDREKLIDSYLKELIIYTERHQRIAFQSIEQILINDDLSVSAKCRGGEVLQLFEMKPHLGFFPMELESDELSQIHLDHVIGFKEMYSLLWTLQYLPAIYRLSQYIIEQYNPQSQKELIKIGTQINYSLNDEEYNRLVDELLLIQFYCRIQLLSSSKNLGQGKMTRQLQQEFEAIEEATQDDIEGLIVESEEKDKSERIFSWHQKTETKVYKIIHLFIRLYKSKIYLTTNEFINAVSEEGISTNPYGAVRSLMSNAGNSYGKIFEEDETGCIDFAENLHSRRGEIHELYGFTSALPTVEEIQEEQEELNNVMVLEHQKDYSLYRIAGVVESFNKTNLPTEVVRYALEHGAKPSDIRNLADRLHSARIGVTLLKSEDNWISNDGVQRAHQVIYNNEDTLYVSNQWTIAGITKFIDAINNIKEGIFGKINISRVE